MFAQQPPKVRGKRPRPYSSGLALVLKGKLQPSSEPGDFTVLDLYIHFDNLGDAQITQRACCGLHRNPRRILPGLGTRADYFRYSVD